MPRKHPSRGYYDEEEIYDVDQGRPRARHRSKRDRVIEEEDFHPRRRASMPPVEEMERMRIKDRHTPSSPEYVRESSHTKGKGKAQPPPPPPPSQGLKFRRGRGEVKGAPAIPPPPPSPPSEAERDEYQPSSRAKKPAHGRNGRKAEPEEYVTKDRHSGAGAGPGGGKRGKAKQIAALMSDSEDDISVKRSSRAAAAAAAAAPPPPPPLPGALPEDDEDEDESEAEFVRRERRRRKGKMIEPNYSTQIPIPPQFPPKPNMGRHRGKEREDARRPRRVSSESDESETDSTEETASSTEESEEDDEEDDELVILKDEWGRGQRRSRSLSRPAIKSRRDDSSPGSPSLRELEVATRHGSRRPKYIEQGNCIILST